MDFVKNTAKSFEILEDINCTEHSKKKIKKQIRIIKRRSRVRLSESRMFPTTVFGVIVLGAFVSTAVQITEFFYQIFDITEITGKNTDVFQKAGGAYFEYMLCMALVVPLVSGIYRLCMKISGDNSAEQVFGVGILFEMFEPNEKLFALYAVFAVKSAVPYLFLTIFTTVSGKCEYLARQTIGVLSHKSYEFGVLMNAGAENFVLLIGAAYKLIVCTVCIAAVVMINRALYFSDFLILNENTSSPVKAMLTSVKMSHGCGRHIGLIYRKFVLWMLLSVFTFGMAAVFAIPYYLVVKAGYCSACLTAFEARNREKVLSKGNDALSAGLDSANNLLPILYDEKNDLTEESV